MNVIIVQPVVVLNMNTEVFKIHDMNTLYKIGDLKYNGKYFMLAWGKHSHGPNLPQLKWPNLPLADYFQISRDISFKDAREAINNILYRCTLSFRNKNIEFKSES